MTTKNRALQLGPIEQQVLLGAFVVSLVLLQGIKLKLVPSMSSTKMPPPLEERRGDLANDPNVGSLIPSSLRKYKFPIVISVHTECPSCSLTIYDKIVTCYKNTTLLNVVVSDQEKFYFEMAQKYPNARVASGDTNLVSQMNPIFSPRIYAFNKEGRLVYIQKPTQQSTEVAIEDALSKLRQ